MRAITVVPLQANSARLDDIGEPDPADGALLVETLAVGVCGTDAEIVSGDYGWAPPGHERLVLGHESLGRVLEAPASSGFGPGDLVVAIVRRPDPVPCYACARGEWDACRNGQYTEHGIKQLDGFMRERYRVEPDAAVKLDASLAEVGMLLEPTTVVAKAWQQIDAVGTRSVSDPRTAVVVGAGPIGMLAALLGVQRGLEVHVIDQVTTGLKPDLVKQLGASYHTGAISDACAAPDVIVECTGIPKLVFDAMDELGSGGILCLTGISSIHTEVDFDGGSAARDLVLKNGVVVGSVNANRAHYEAAAKALGEADTAWLARLITRREPMENFAAALERRPDDVKVVIEIAR